MKTPVFEKKENIILDYTFSYDNKIQIPNWQKWELDKTDKRVQKELKENGFIKTSSITESYDRTTNFINNLYKI